MTTESDGATVRRINSPRPCNPKERIQYAKIFAQGNGLPDDFWDNAVIVEPVTKEAISWRVDDDDVLAWFRAGGQGLGIRPA